MHYIAEFWSEAEVWLVSSSGKLISIHTSLDDAQQECFKLHNVNAKVVDRSGGKLPTLVVNT